MRSWHALVAVLLIAVVVAPAAAQAKKKQAAKTPKDKAKNAAMATIEDDPKLPRVLIIGDSISIGYTIPVPQALKGVANVHRIPTNGGPTTNGGAHIDEWLGDSHWDVIHFNWGLHDLKYVDASGKNIAPDQGTQQVPPADYASNIKKLVERMKKTGATLIFATTTPVPTGEPQRKADDSVAYNQIAAPIMQEHGVKIDDLHSFSLKHDGIQLPNNVHYTPEGYKTLGAQVAKEIKSVLPIKK